MQYKCMNCFLGYIEETYLKDGKCPECGSSELEKHCEKDVPCHCAKQIHETIAYCDVCGEAVCPGCGCHDVTQISRVTGYLNEISGMNMGKQQEIKDRQRYTIENGVAREIVK